MGEQSCNMSGKFISDLRNNVAKIMEVADTIQQKTIWKSYDEFTSAQAVYKCLIDKLNGELEYHDCQYYRRLRDALAKQIVQKFETNTGPPIDYADIIDYKNELHAVAEVFEDITYLEKGLALMHEYFNETIGDQAGNGEVIYGEAAAKFPKGWQRTFK